MTLVLRLMGHSIGNRTFREDDKPKKYSAKANIQYTSQQGVKNHVNK